MMTEQHVRARSRNAHGSIVESGPGRYRLCTDLSFGTVATVLRELRTVLRGSKGVVEFDLAEVERSDSAGVALLLELLKMARQGGYRLHFTHVPRQLEVLAAVSGVDGLLL
jgi:phospholipid transport system transporter-binding protein